MSSTRFAASAQAENSEIWYLRDLTAAGTCGGAPTLKLLSETIGGTSVVEHDIEGANNISFDREEVAGRTIESGNWEVRFWFRLPTGGGPANQVDVKIERFNSTCALQETIFIRNNIKLDKGVTKEYLAQPKPVGQVVFVAGDFLVVTFTDSGGNQSKFLRYDFDAANTADSRLITPDPVVVAATTSLPVFQRRMRQVARRF